MGPVRPSLETWAGTWPTPKAWDTENPKTPKQLEAQRARAKPRKDGGPPGIRNLKDTAANWPTPTCADAESSGSRKHGVSLSDASKGNTNWATPNARDWKSEDGTHSPDHSPPLGRQVLAGAGPESSPSAGQQWPTPNAVAGHNNGTMDEYGGKNNPFRGTPAARLRLNPTFVEWLMGWPRGWTVCAPAGTASFQSWQRLHSACLRSALGSRSRNSGKEVV